MRTAYSVRLAMFVAASLVMGLVFTARAEDKAAPASQPAGATGTWKWQIPTPNGDMDVVLKLKQDGDKLTGTITGFGGDEMDIEDGKIKDDQISFKTTREFGGNQVTTTYTGTVAGGALKGKSETVFSRSFEGKRSN